MNELEIQNYDKFTYSLEDALMFAYDHAKIFKMPRKWFEHFYFSVDGAARNVDGELSFACKPKWCEHHQIHPYTEAEPYTETPLSHEELSGIIYSIAKQYTFYDADINEQIPAFRLHFEPARTKKGFKVYLAIPDEVTKHKSLHYVTEVWPQEQYQHTE